MKTVQVGMNLSMADILAVGNGTAKAVLNKETCTRIEAAHALVKKYTDGSQDKAVYGVNTGFGALAEHHIDKSDLEKLQRNLIRSHACGTGEPLSEVVVRMMLLLRANVLALGHSGTRVEVVQRLLDLLEYGIHPVIPSRGSVGASGDLAPLAHLALTLIGEADVDYQGKRMSAEEALAQVGLTPLTLEAKEGLSLINGTQAMTAVGLLAFHGAQRAVRFANVVGAWSLDALLGTVVAFDARINQLRPHPGQERCSAILRELLADSEINQSHTDCEKVQDPYSLRCMPQVHGAVWGALDHIGQVLETESNSVTDNPLVFPETGQFLSGGNFHGAPVAFALDYLAQVMTALMSISERRIEQLVNPNLSSGLPAFLITNTGLNSGLMIAQVSAASLVTEGKVLSHPASVDSIPSSANREDHVSMGMTAALKALTVVDYAEKVLAIESLCAAQGIDLRLPLKPGPRLQQIHDGFRKRVPFLTEDTHLAPHIQESLEWLRSEEWVASLP